MGVAAAMAANSGGKGRDTPGVLSRGCGAPESVDTGVVVAGFGDGGSQTGREDLPFCADVQHSDGPETS